MNSYDDLLSNVPAKAEGEQFSKEEYAARKQSEREALYELSDKSALGIAGDSGMFRQYLDVQSRFIRYSPANALLILAQKPESTRLGSFDYWKSHGGFVKPGQTGISILEPGKEYERKDGGGMAIGYNVKKVFDASQVDTRRMKARPQSKYDDRQLLHSLIHKAPVKISSTDDLLGALGAVYDPQADSISVRKGMEFPDTFRSVAQELAFADMTTGPDTQENPHFSAYCVSYMLCCKYGIDTQAFDFTDASVVFDGMDALAVKGEISQIHDSAENISARMERQLGTLQKAPAQQEAR